MHRVQADPGNIHRPDGTALRAADVLQSNLIPFRRSGNLRKMESVVAVLLLLLLTLFFHQPKTAAAIAAAAAAQAIVQTQQQPAGWQK